MDYKKLIIEMLDKIQDQSLLERIYNLSEYLYLYVEKDEKSGN